MEILLSPAMLASIDSQVLKMRKSSTSILDVCNASEAIRVKHIYENVAREDIIEEIVLRAGLNVTLGLNSPENQPHEILEVITGPSMEMLIPMDLKFTH
jgi:hypothetical protein